MLHCQGCHLSDGRGFPGRVPGLRDLTRFARTAEGRAYLVRVPGVAQADLDDARVAALLDWVLANLGDDTADPPDVARFSAEEVARARGVPVADLAALRRAVLEAAGGS